MPKTRHQGGLGLCYAAVAATLIDEYKCYGKNNTDCASVPDSQKMSMLDIARFTQRITDQDARRDRENYQGIPENGTTYSVMLGAWLADSVVSADCLPENSHFLKGLSPDMSGAMDGGPQGALWERLKQFHKMLGGSKLTLEQAMTLKRDFVMRQDGETIQTAFSQKDWALVLDYLLVPRHCADNWQTQLSVGDTKMAGPKFWPSNDDHDAGKRPTYKETIAKIKSILTVFKRPIGVSFCANIKPGITSTEQCGAAGYGHAIVFEGYRQMCDRTAACVDSVKIRNSWGDKWQAENNDGWIDAKTLLNATFYDSQNFTWLENKPRLQ